MTTLQTDGERFLPDQMPGTIALEHMHRYLFCAPLVAGREVLDIASGEGYGSALLARSATRVTGVDIDAGAVDWARKRYQAPNLEYRVGDCREIPLDDASVDVVVSFETLEHHEHHEAMMLEVRRVLRPGGLLIISTPDREVYSDNVGFHNPFHVKELYEDEFRALLARHFGQLRMLRQKVTAGSLLTLDDDAAALRVHVGANDVQARSRLPEAPFLVAVASDAPLPPIEAGLLEEPIPALAAPMVREWVLKSAAMVKAAAQPGSEVLRARLDGPYYLTHNPDLSSPTLDRYEHWTSNGAAEGRVPDEDLAELVRELVAEREAGARRSAAQAITEHHAQALLTLSDRLGMPTDAEGARDAAARLAGPSQASAAAEQAAEDLERWNDALARLWQRAARLHVALDDEREATRRTALRHARELRAAALRTDRHWAARQHAEQQGALAAQSALGEALRQAQEQAAASNLTLDRLQTEKAELLRLIERERAAALGERDALHLAHEARETARRQEAQDTERLLRQEASAREQAISAEAQRREQALLDEARQREQALRQTAEQLEQGLRAELQAAQAGLHQLASEQAATIQALQARFEALRAQDQRDAHERTQALEGEIGRLRGTRQALEDRVAVRDSELSAARAHLSEAFDRIARISEEATRERRAQHMAQAQERAVLLRRLGQIQQSWSWRLTAPLRALASPLTRRTPDALTSDVEYAQLARYGGDLEASENIPTELPLAAPLSGAKAPEFMIENRSAGSPATPVSDIYGLLRLEGPDFLRAAYRQLLEREPDASGMAHYQDQLQRGISKSEILEQICSGQEYARAQGRVDGLQRHLSRYRLKRRLTRAMFGRTATPAPAAAATPSAAALPAPSTPSVAPAPVQPAAAEPAALPAGIAPGSTDALVLQRLEAIEARLADLAGDTIDKHLESRFHQFNPEAYLEHNPDVAAAGINPFEHWVVAGQRERRRWGQRSPAAAAAAAAAAGAPVNQLPEPDGVWEWADADALRSQFAAAREAHQSQWTPRPAQALSLAGADLARAATQITLPAPSQTPRVSIVLPVFNHLAETLECLESIARDAAAYPDFEVIIADDCSEPAVSEVLKTVRHARVLRHEVNQGFLRNCNAARQLARGEWVLFLNNDVQVPAGWLGKLEAAFGLSPRVGIVGPAFVYPSGHLQEAGGMFRSDGSAIMVGLNDNPTADAYSYPRRVDYVSGACLMIRRTLLDELGGFSEAFLPCYCEDSDLCLRAIEAGHEVWVEPRVRVLHHLSRTTGELNHDFKMRAATKNISTLLRRHAPALATRLPRVLAFYLPQFHPFPENNLWWGEGFTEWTNVSKAKPNFVGHDQPRQPADLGYYDLRLNEVLVKQAALAQRYGVDGFVFYYYWFGGKRLLERPIEDMLDKGTPDFPFCLCWANENWTRRWDGRDRDLLIAQAHSEEDDLAVIADLARYLRDARNIRIDGRPLLLVYRVTLFPDFAATAARWRQWCRDNGIGEIYLAMVESFELVQAGKHPSDFGCDAAVEFPPQGLAHMTPPHTPLLNPDFNGHVANYRDLAVAYATREQPAYTRFRGVMPGWDNTARRQNEGLAFEGSTPGAFQAWMADVLEQTLRHRFGDERLVFVNAWNEWAEGAYLEPDRRYSHAFLQAVRNAREDALLRINGPQF